MFNLDSITKENNKKHNDKWPYIRDHPYRIIIIGGSGSGKTNALINLISEQNDIDKIYLYARDLREQKVAWWLATCARKPKVPGSSAAAIYVQRWALCSNRLANV